MNYREVRDLTEIILKNFMRVMKDEDKYILLLNGFNSNMYKSLLKNYTIKKNEIYNNRDIYHIVDYLVYITGNEPIIQRRFIMILNILLHEFLEINGIGMDKINDIGDKTLRHTFKELYSEKADYQLAVLDAIMKNETTNEIYKKYQREMRYALKPIDFTSYFIDKVGFNVENKLK